MHTWAWGLRLEGCSPSGVGRRREGRTSRARREEGEVRGAYDGGVELSKSSPIPTVTHLDTPEIDHQDTHLREEGHFLREDHPVHEQVQQLRAELLGRRLGQDFIEAGAEHECEESGVVSHRRACA